MCGLEDNYAGDVKSFIFFKLNKLQNIYLKLINFLENKF